MCRKWNIETTRHEIKLIEYRHDLAKPKPFTALTMPEDARFIFKGKLRTDAFIAFAQHRAARLDLAMEIGNVSDEAITLRVHGHAELVDAFEMACSLGPYECLVLDVARLN